MDCTKEKVGKRCALPGVRSQRENFTVQRHPRGEIFVEGRPTSIHFPRVVVERCSDCLKGLSWSSQRRTSAFALVPPIWPINPMTVTSRPLSRENLETKAVLFDFGGTLLEYRREEVMRALLKEQGIQSTSSEVLRAYETVEPAWNRLFSELTDSERFTDDVLRNLDRMIIKHLGVKGDLDQLASYVQRNWDRMDQQLPRDLVRRPYQDGRPCLEALASKGLQMGIVSNIQSEERLREELLNIDLLHFFPVLIASGSVGIDKPSRGIFELAANKIGVEPRQTMFVGDDLERDYNGSREAGMNPVLIDRNERYASHTYRNRISSLEQLQIILK